MRRSGRVAIIILDNPYSGRSKGTNSCKNIILYPLSLKAFRNK